MELTNRQKRSIRLKAAKEKGNHSTAEWLQMLEFFENTCCACLGDRGYSFVEKDHIIPLYQSGSNHIRNLQPLCSGCNASKGADTSDWRPQLADHLGKELPELYTNPF